MARRIRIIGIGAGNPEHMTVEGINALNSCDVIFIPDKGDEKAFLGDLRHQICLRFITGKQPRLIDFDMPVRGRQTDYVQTVNDWHAAIAEIYENLLAKDVEPDETVGLLVWGDPMLYDSTIRIIERVHQRGRIEFDYDVIPGISSLQALCARHRIPLNGEIGGAVEVMTGRMLAQGWPAGVSDVAVMLDGVQAFQTLDLPDANIYWGAYLGTPMEITLSGNLLEMSAEIVETRQAARAEHGWIMDTYIVRRPDQGGDGR